MSQEHVGRIHTFPDGATITIIQVKHRDDGDWVTYEQKRGPGIPQRLLLPAGEFWKTFGHLFP